MAAAANRAAWRERGLYIVLTLAIGFFAFQLNRHYAIRTWLFWRYLGYCALAATWLLSCYSAGSELLRRLGGERLVPVERPLFGLALGVLAFGLGVFFVGLVHGLNAVTFVLLPGAFLAFGRRQVTELFTLARARCRAGWQLSVPHALGWAAAVVALAIIYFQLLSPDAYSFDVRWYHMPIAQRYALRGAIEPAVEGFWPAAFPHLMSYVFAWAFLLPGALLFDRIVLGAHLEFALFIATLMQVSVAVRSLLPGTRAPLLWATLLLFPGIYIYDLNLHAGADHVTAFWALPIALACFRAWYRFDVFHAGLVALMLGASVLTKYTALILVAPAGAVIFLRGAYLALRSAEARRALGMLVVGSLVVTAPHWLKNIIWYGDPLYPVLHHHFDVSPSLPEFDARLAPLEATGRPGSFTLPGLLRGLLATVDFSFRPNNWEFLYGAWPVFGSLFTLTLPALFFLRRAKRVAWLYAGCMAGVFVWYMLSHYDRYLQALVPAMAAATACVFALILRQRRVVRGLLLGLIALQSIWALDLPFVRTHNLLHDSPIRHAAAFVPSGFERRQGSRLRVYEPLYSIGESLPQDATVLAHNHLMILGLDRDWVTDQHQARFNYLTSGSPAGLHQELRALGVTHLVWTQRSLGRDSLGEELAFLNYAINFTDDKRLLHDNWVAALPSAVPDSGTDHATAQVAYLGCHGPYAKGMYSLSQLNIIPRQRVKSPRPTARITDVKQALAQADFVVTDSTCPTKVWVNAPFVRAGAQGNEQMFVRELARAR